MKRIAVLTSGGDSPGMNAAIRAVVRTSIHYHIRVTGVMYGYEGMINNELVEMGAGSVSNIIQRGGTILKTSRSQSFKTKEGMGKAMENLKSAGVEGLIVIGGDGTFRGANEFMKFSGIPVMGLPGTIDNDLVGTDFTIGYDTAINTVIKVVDKIRDTAESHDRLFFVEVMGRDAGLIALRSGIAVGAEAILIPEAKTDIEHLFKKLELKSRRKKSSYIIIVAEGERPGGAFELARQVEEKLAHFDTRISILGHLQRGGSPTCMDRVLASRLGYCAVEAIHEGRSGEMVGQIDKQIVFTPFPKAIKHIVDLNNNLLRIADILSM